MAQAILALYPNAKFFVGPAIEDGFYYDFRVTKENGEKLGKEDLPAIEKKMKEFIDAKEEIAKICSTKSEIANEFKNDDLKQEVLKRIPDGEVSVYKQGDFKDI